ncbi:ANK2, partial [Symbiodinium pilosum]
MSQQSWRSRKTDVTEDEEHETAPGEEVKKTKKSKPVKQPDMALYEQAEAFNKTLPTSIDFSVSQ